MRVEQVDEIGDDRLQGLDLGVGCTGGFAFHLCAACSIVSSG
jgi:hypothetical protein